MNKTILMLTATVVAVCGAVNAATYYVDSAKGDDAADGLSPKTAWRTLERVNNAAIKAGDCVRFKRGGLWRGTLRGKSGADGAPVVYTNYGKGPKPIIQGSVDRSRPSDWEETAPGVWATRKFKYTVGDQVWDGTDCQGWSACFMGDAKGSLKVQDEDDIRFLRVECVNSPAKRDAALIQIWGPQVRTLTGTVAMKLRVRASIPFKLGQIRADLHQSPWTVGWSGKVRDKGGDNMVGTNWTTVVVRMTRVNMLPDGGSPHLVLGDMLPKGCVFDFVPVGFWGTKSNTDECLSHDVGIFLVNHGEKWGVKKWKLDDLKNDLDYWDDRENMRVFVKSEKNPGERFKSIELALTRHAVGIGGHDIVYDGLAVRYTGAHGFGGANVRNITIRNCDIYWIGGGLQFWQTNSKGERRPVRFGNGIEFWTGCDNCLVERNRLWQIYDAALTNQGDHSPAPETNIVWRDNVIWQAEYSFEFWNHDMKSRSANIVFEHNTCIDAGYGWAHGQRPDPNGAHLMFYDNAAPTTGVVVRNNLFVRTTNRSTRLCNDWRKDLTMSRNLYWIPENKIFECTLSWWRAKYDTEGLKGRVFGAGEAAFKDYQSAMKMDLDSVYGEPQFVNEAKRDYRLKPGTFGSNLATDGGPIGARDMPGLDADQSL